MDEKMEAARSAEIRIDYEADAAEYFGEFRGKAPEHDYYFEEGWHHGYDRGYDSGWNDRGAANEWMRIETESDLPQWPKPYLWHFLDVKGKPKYKVQVFQPIQAKWFASVYSAWQEIAPYQPAPNGSTEGK